MIDAISNMNQTGTLNFFESFRAAKSFLDEYYWKNETTELRTIVSGMALSSKNIAADADTMYTWRECIDSVRRTVDQSNTIKDCRNIENQMEAIPARIAFFTIIEYLRHYNINWKSDQFSEIIADVESARVGSGDVDEQNVIWRQWLEAVKSGIVPS